MATLLADPPGAAPGAPPSPAGSAGDAPEPGAGPREPARSCRNCGSELHDGQDWCLQCGAGAPNSLDAHTPGWRSAAAILAAVVILVAGAATAAVAALDKSSPRPARTALALTPAPAASTPVVPATPAAPGAKVGTPTTVKPLIPLPKAKPPKIPLSPTPTPKAVTPIVPPTTGGSTQPTSTTPSKTGSEKTSNEGQAPSTEALVLDTDAASTYNPYGYPASNFGDPSLAIDDDRSTAWTAQVEPASAPKMAEGLLIDLKAPQKVAAIELHTSTPGMTLQVYGANGSLPPSSITEAGWTPLSRARVEQQRKARIDLGTGSAALSAAAKHGYRFVVLWISRAPADASATAEAPQRVSVEELELFPPNS